jgi:hypothetical protein
MTCCDVEPIGTLTGVLAHFRYYRRGSRKEVKTQRELGKGKGVVGAGMVGVG